jgi:hypothetical protein
VIKACLYEPQVNRTCAEMAGHYDTAILPARPRRPRDKAKVEAAVLIVERRLLGRLRHRRFCSLAELNAAIGELLHQLNAELPIRRLGVTRRALLEELDRPHLKPLPAEPYTYAEWRLPHGSSPWAEGPRVGIDYHVEVEAHFYSDLWRFDHAISILSALMNAASAGWDMSVRISGECLFSGPIDREFGDMLVKPGSEANWTGPKQFVTAAALKASASRVSSRTTFRRWTGCSSSKTFSASARRPNQVPLKSDLFRAVRQRHSARRRGLWPERLVRSFQRFRLSPRRCPGPRSGDAGTSRGHEDRRTRHAGAV